MSVNFSKVTDTLKGGPTYNYRTFGKELFYRMMTLMRGRFVLRKRESGDTIEIRIEDFEELISTIDCLYLRLNIADSAMRGREFKKCVRCLRWHRKRDDCRS